jgi:hypothetical protein
MSVQEDESHVNECPICLGKLACDHQCKECHEMLSCGHLFHGKCIKEWMEDKWNTGLNQFNQVTCPMCRTVFKVPAMQVMSTDVAKLRADNIRLEKAVSSSTRVLRNAIAGAEYLAREAKKERNQSNADVWEAFFKIADLKREILEITTNAGKTCHQLNCMYDAFKQHKQAAARAAVWSRWVLGVLVVVVVMLVAVVVIIMG